MSVGHFSTLSVGHLPTLNVDHLPTLSVGQSTVSHIESYKATFAILVQCHNLKCYSIATTDRLREGYLPAFFGLKQQLENSANFCLSEFDPCLAGCNSKAQAEIQFRERVDKYFGLNRFYTRQYNSQYKSLIKSTIVQFLVVQKRILRL